MADPYADVRGIDFDPRNAEGTYEFLVELHNSVPKPKGSTEVVRTAHGWIFPEDVTFINHQDEQQLEQLYALGAVHSWRTSDMEVWEVVA